MGPASRRGADARPLWLAVAGTLAIVLCACGPTPAGSPAQGAPANGSTGPTASDASPAAAQTGPVPVVVDTDLSADDTLAIAYLLRQPAVEVIAITVSGTGLVHCPKGLVVITNLLATMDADVPVACGRSEPYDGGHEFPAEWRTRADAGYGLALDTRPVTSSGLAAPELLAKVAANAGRPVTILELGPMTNLADVLADGSLAPRLERVVAMAGALDVAGNVDLGAGALPAEWNVYADPVAADRVLTSGVPVLLVPLDATHDAPVNAAFMERLASDHAAAGADIANELLLRGGLAQGDDFWDPLAAAVLVDERLATIQDASVEVVTDPGGDNGRTRRSAAGAPVRVATAADQAAFETAFLAGLRAGDPRAHPFELAGTITVAFDGSTCAITRTNPVAAGDWLVKGSATAPGGTVVALVRFKDGKGWDDLVAYVATAKAPDEPPSFVDVTGFALAVGGQPAQFMATLASGRYGVSCLNYPSGSGGPGTATLGEAIAVP